jgi:hypothetical protein
MARECRWPEGRILRADVHLREIRGNVTLKIPENPIYSIETMNLTIKLTVVSIPTVEKPIVLGGFYDS